MSTSRIPGFYRLPLPERRARLAALGLANDHVAALDVNAGLELHAADHMVENCVGILGMPLGVALNFVVNGEPVVVPMAVEEPSVVAACSHIASLALQGGGFTTEMDPPHMVGQIQLIGLDDTRRAQATLDDNRDAIAAKVNDLCDGMVKRGGGFVDFELRELPPVADGLHREHDDDTAMHVLDVVIDCRDAMGANAINSVVEGLAPMVTDLIGGRAHLRILSNLTDRRKARASFSIPFAALAGKCGDDVDKDARGREVAQGIVDAYRFAARDPYRASTHNKGVMNGIDAVAIATGNDWRAIEAGAHAYAARNGSYSSLTRFTVDEAQGTLRGAIELPMAIGTVGGATRVHPTVKACRALLGAFADSAEALGGLIAAVGLAQNTGALKALATEGIQRGHMKLHARQVAMAAGADGDDVQRIADQLVAEGNIRADRARSLLAGGAA